MTARKLAQTVFKKIYFKIFLSAFIIVALVLYFKAFFTVGVYFDNNFLKKEVISSSNHYVGKSKFGDIHIIVLGLKNKQSSADVIYRLPNGTNRQYMANFKDANNWDSGITKIKDIDGNIIFEGEYKKGNPVLLDKSGKPLLNVDIQYTKHVELPYNKDYKVPLMNIAAMASFANDQIRGKFGFLLLAVILFARTLIDIKFPLFFFKLRYFIDVKEAEPSNLYIVSQRISWYVVPVIGLILMIVAIII